MIFRNFAVATLLATVSQNAVAQTTTTPQQSSPTQTATPTYTSLTVFGDSIVDAGNDLAIGVGAYPSQGYFEGRFTNGYDYPDLISINQFGTPTTASLKGGTNYAFGGARATTTSLVVDLAGQLASYKLDILARGADPTGLVVLNFGANDVFAFTGSGLPPSFIGSDAYLRQADSDYAQGIQTLNDLGVRNFLVAGFPDLKGSELAVAVQAQGYFTEELAKLNLASGTTLTQLSFIDLFNRIRADPTAFGLPATLIPPTVSTCQDGGAFPACTGYFSIDGTHPIAAIQRLIYDQANQQLTLGTAYGGPTVLSSGTTTVTAPLVSDSFRIAPGATLTGVQGTTILSTGATLDIVNSGTISNTATSGRAINIAGDATVRTVTLTNNAGGLITSGGDAVRIATNLTRGSVRVDNYGVIRSTNDGQAIDFDALAGGAAIRINNYAGAEISAAGQDAIRPGQGAVVTNAGLIRSDGTAGSSYDASDWQARSGVVVNEAGGTISGLRHGITGDVSVDVTNRGTIVGRNGSGVGSDGTGIVVNYGTITGGADGVAANGDGDGVDIDRVGVVRNFGTIEGLAARGVDAGGRPNSAQGIALGGGTIENAASATIFGAAQGILVNNDTNAVGAADAATTIVNAGTIRGGTGAGIVLVGNFADTVTTSGVIAGGNGVALDLDAGDDTLNVLTGASFVGALDGGAGTDRINLGGIGTGTLGATTGFETLAVQSGSWTLAAPSTYANGITVAAPATLSGTAATLTGAIDVAGRLAFDQTTEAGYAGTLTGTGTLVKQGTAALTLGGQTGFTGTTTVAAGRLVLAGALPSAVTVASGGTLGGTGTVTSLTVAGGGIVAPGDGIGTLAITGAFAQAAGSTYSAQTTAAGLSDRIVVGGTATIANGAVLNVARNVGAYAIGTRYTLLTASGGIAGTYQLVQADGGGTELRLVQTGTSIGVDVARSGAALVALAASSNQRSVAPSFRALGVGNAAYAALTLLPNDAVVRSGLETVAGEVHASVKLAAIRDAQAVEDGVAARMFATNVGSGLWGQLIGHRGEDDGGRGTASLDRRGWGAFGGADVTLGDAGRIGVAGGYTRTRLSIDDRDSRATVKNTHLLGYASSALGPVAVRVQGGYAWTDYDVTRTVVFPGFAATPRSGYDGNVLHGSAELGIRRPMMGGTVEPFVDVAGYRVSTEGFAESASAVALQARSQRQSFVLTSAGVRGETPITNGMSARSRLAWQHVIDEGRPDATMQFVSGSLPFTVTGARLSRNTALLAIDVEWRPIRNLAITSGYSGAIGGNGNDSSFRLMGSLSF